MGGRRKDGEGGQEQRKEGTWHDHRALPRVAMCGVWERERERTKKVHFATAVGRTDGANIR